MTMSTSENAGLQQASLATTEKSETDDNPPFIALMEQLKQALDRGMHLQLSPEHQLLAIHTMADAILRIRRNMNSLVPVNKLPAELLTLIFEYAISRDERMAFFDRNPEDVAQPHCADIVGITHVCHGWRSAALATSRLWTYIDSRYHSAMLAAFLSRSRAALLRLHFTRAHSSDLTRLVKNCGHRLRRFDIAQVRGEIKLQSLEFDASRLECATISANIQEPVPPPGHTDLRTKLTAFERTISSLKGLAVYNSHGYWVPITHFPDLTHLFLCHHWGAHRRPLLHALMVLLSNTPRLQVLHLPNLCDTSLDLPANTEVSSRLVALPHLKLLACNCADLRSTLQLLASLEFPQEVHVYLEHDDYDPTETPLEPYGLRSTDWLDGLTRLEVTVAGQSLRMVAEGHRSGLWIEGQHVPLDVHHWLRPLETMLSLGSIHSLDFSAQPGRVYTESLLHDLLSRLPSLVTLRFPLQPRRPTLECYEFRDISFYTPEAGLFLVLTPGEGEPVTCPNLTTLYVEAGPKQLKSLSPTITDMLAARADAGAPVKTLTLRVLQSVDVPRRRKRDSEPLEPELPLQVQTTFSTAASHVEDLHLEFESAVPTPRETTGSTSGTLWDLSEEMEKYWIVPKGTRPPWLGDSP